MPPPADGFTARLVLGPALRMQPDRRLVALVRGGYELAFEEIVRRYGRPLTRYAGAIVGGRAEDVTQDAFSKALLALRRDGAEIELRPWLFRIVRNTALNELRDRPPAPEALAEAIAGGNNPAEELERREELTDLMQRLQSLPEPQRAAIVMREMEGLSHEEIAAALGFSGGAARQAIYRARQALREGLGMLLPLPLMRLLIDHGADAAAVGVGASGTAATGGVLGGAGVALKAGVVTAVLAGSVGTGIALHDRDHGNGDTSAATTPRTTTTGPDADSGAVASGDGASSDDSGEGRGKGESVHNGNDRSDDNAGQGSHGDHHDEVDSQQALADDGDRTTQPGGERHGSAGGDHHDGSHGSRSGNSDTERGGGHHSGPGGGGEDGSGGGSGGGHSSDDPSVGGQRGGGPGPGGESHSGGGSGSGGLVPPPPPPEEELPEAEGGSGSGGSGSGRNDELP